VASKIPLIALYQLFGAQFCSYFLSIAVAAVLGSTAFLGVAALELFKDRQPKLYFLS
jgi:hypothetical protein